MLLTIPGDDNDRSLAATFNDLLAKAYIHGEPTDVKEMLRFLSRFKFDQLRGEMLAMLARLANSGAE
ncbi:hypothetical protein ACX9NJ_28035 [Mycobacterium sp. ML2]|uniref:hypothetical protein n=1 Tax=Mycobacterium sp. MS3 TaxID=3391378 RepID=UPI003988A295